PNYFDGTIDQVVVYKKALGPMQLVTLYQTRMPGASQVYTQPTDYPAGSGLIRSSKASYEGTYLYAAVWYDSRGHAIESSDMGRSSTGGPIANHTLYEYSALDGQDY